jgi:hypothetical protein
MTGDQFTTKDSGERVQWSTGMQRDTTKGKLLASLLIPLLIPFKETMLYRWIALLTRGAEKYAARNWEQAKTTEELDRFKDSAFRHFLQWFAGETDEDHAAAVFFNIQGAEYVKSRLEKNPLPMKADPVLEEVLRPKGITTGGGWQNTVTVSPDGNHTLYRQQGDLLFPREAQATPKYRSLGEDEMYLLLGEAGMGCECENCTQARELVKRVVLPLKGN